MGNGLIDVNIFFKDVIIQSLFSSPDARFQLLHIVVHFLLIGFHGVLRFSYLFLKCFDFCNHRCPLFRRDYRKSTIVFCFYGVSVCNTFIFWFFSKQSIVNSEAIVILLVFIDNFTLYCSRCVNC